MAFHLTGVAAAVFTAILFLCYKALATDRVPNGLKRLPGPKGLPILGSLLDFPPAFAYHKMKEWSDEYGPILQVKILGRTHVILSETKIATDLMAMRGAIYSGRATLEMLKLVTHTGNLGLVNSDHRLFIGARKFAQSMLTNTSLKPWYPRQEKQARRLVLDLLRDPEQYEYLFERYSTAHSVASLYGKSIEGSPDEPDHVRNIMHINRTLERTGQPGAYLVDFIPILKYLPEFMAPFKQEAAREHAFEYGFFSKLYNESYEQWKNGKAMSPPPFAHCYFARKDEFNLSEFEIIYALGVLYEGSSGTTSAAMMSFCLAMWHHPEWQEKIQEEVDRVVGPDRLPSIEDWPNLPLVRAAMKETLRWRAVTPGGIPHVLARDDEYQGYFIPKNSVIHANQYAMNREEKLYPDPEKYNPDRWLDPAYPTYREPLTQYPNLQRYTAFGGGRRICPGLLSAEKSLFVIISTMAWASTVTKVCDARGRVIPVPWYDMKPGANTSPKRFKFGLESRGEEREKMLLAGHAGAVQVVS